MTRDAYMAHEGINWSTLKYADTSMLHYKHVVDNPPEDTTRFGVGRAIHTAILQPERLALDYTVFEGKTRRGKAWDAFEAENVSKTILKRSEWDAVEALAKRVKADETAQKWLHLESALIERAITWTDRVTGLSCKGKPDAVNSAIVDVKSTGNIDERVFRALAARMGYFGQLAFYRRGYHTLTKLWLPCAIVAVEADAPHDIGVFVVDEESLRVADEKISRLLSRVAECRKTNVWPGRYQKAQTLTMPEWAKDGDEYNFTEAA